MIVIPELDTIVYQPPRTGSTSLRNALIERYPNAISLFRHMERDGTPEAWRHCGAVCVIRHPVHRLHSLWRYMRAQRPEDHSDKEWVARINRDAGRPFNSWLAESRDPFTGRPGSKIDNPGYYDIRHPLPATRKSQFAWARPDLGPVEILRMEDAPRIEARFDLALPHLNAAPGAAIPDLDPEARAVIEAHHSWELGFYEAARLPGAQEAPFCACLA